MREGYSRGEAETAPRGAAERPVPARPYERPRLVRYGSLIELTGTVNTVTPGDSLGGSFST